MDDDRPDLPPEAGEITRSGFEPDDEWLKTAEPEIRQEAMRTWFLTRYGNEVVIATQTLNQLRDDVVAFVEEIEGHLKKLFPDKGSLGLGQVDDF